MCNLWKLSGCPKTVSAQVTPVFKNRKTPETVVQIILVRRQQSFAEGTQSDSSRSSETKH